MNVVTCTFQPAQHWPSGMAYSTACMRVPVHEADIFSTRCNWLFILETWLFEWKVFNFYISWIV